MAIPSTIGQAAQPGAADLARLMQPEAPNAGAVGALRMVATPPFLLRHHPSHWSAESDGLDGTYWLPDISPLPLVAGAHLVKTPKRGEDPSESIKLAVNTDANNGWTVLDPSLSIPAECLPPGVPVGGYRRPVPCVDPLRGTPGTRHLEAWDVPRQWVPGSGPQKYTHHRASYNRWRLWLVTQGIIAPPTDDALEALQQGRAGRVARILARNPAEDIRAKAKAAAEEKLTEAMQTATVPDLAEDARPAPAPRRKGVVKV